MIGPLRYAFGYLRLRVRAEEAAAWLNLCGELGADIFDASHGEGEYAFCCSLLSGKRLCLAAQERGLLPLSSTEGGLPLRLRRYGKRYGLFAGALFCAALLFLSGLVVWDIRIDGERRLEEEEVLFTLAECGLQTGVFRRGLDIDTLENRVMIVSDDISWISINLIGTVAQVEIRESEIPPEEPLPYAASNLIAKKDGQIAYFENVRGNVVTEVGDVVRKGELLVSGLYDSPLWGVRTCRSEGKVIAATEEVLRSEISYRYHKKVYTGERFTEKSLIFFGKEIKFFGNCRNCPPDCDTIEREEIFTLSSGARLPLGIRTVSREPYRYEEALRSEEEARELARMMISYKMALRRENAELLSQKTSEHAGEDSFCLTVTVEWLENIAEEQEIQIDLAPVSRGKDENGAENRQN